MSKIEEVAKAIYADRNGAGCVPWSRLSKAHHAPYISDALAAIRALREPDEGMTGAGAHHLTGHVAATCCHRTGGHGGLGTAAHCECREVFVDIWHAAVDFILSEEGEKP